MPTKAKAKKKPESDLAQDAAAVLEEGIEVTLAGRKTTLRRLDVRAVFRLSRLLMRVFISLGDEAVEMAKTEEGRNYLVYFALSQMEEPTLEFIAWAFSMDTEEFASLPLEAALDAVEALAAQQDLTAFFTRAFGLLAKARQRPTPAPAQ